MWMTKWLEKCGIDLNLWLIFTVLLLSSSTVNCCPDGWLLWEEEQMCYYASEMDDLRNFKDSLEVCESMNATLTSQKSKEEKIFIQTKIQTCGNNCPVSEKYEYWIGLIKLNASRAGSVGERRRAWLWLDGSPFDESWSNWDNTAVLEENKEPNNGDQQARLTYHGYWADKDAPYKCRYICKTGVNQTLETQYPITSQKPEAVTPQKIPTSHLVPVFTLKPSEPVTKNVSTAGVSTQQTTTEYIPEQTKKRTPSENDTRGKTTSSPTSTIAAQPAVQNGEAGEEEETKDKNIPLYVGVSLGTLLLVVVIAFGIIGWRKYKKHKKENDDKKLTERKDIHNFHSNLYAKVDETASTYSSENGVKQEMREKSVRSKKGGSNMMPLYKGTWTSIGSTANPYITNL